jgi:DivIVA domain-containing protein
VERVGQNLGDHSSQQRRANKQPASVAKRGTQVGATKTRAEFGSTKADVLQANKWGRHSIWWRIPIACVLCVMVAGGVAVFINDQFRDASLAAHAKEISVRVVGAEHDSDDSGANDYLWVAIPECSCSVRLGTDNPAAHPKGSTVHVLYDTTNPTNVRLLVDANSAKGGWLVDAMAVVAGFFALWIAYVFAKPELSQLWHWIRRRHEPQTQPLKSPVEGSLRTAKSPVEDPLRTVQPVEDSLRMEDLLRTVKFRLALKGYNVDEVDEFLDALAVKVHGDEALFPEDVTSHEFRIGLKGYSVDEVDEFLQMLAPMISAQPG